LISAAVKQEMWVRWVMGELLGEVWGSRGRVLGVP
jgi:hypothetical protein